MCQMLSWGSPWGRAVRISLLPTLATCTLPAAATRFSNTRAASMSNRRLLAHCSSSLTTSTLTDIQGHVWHTGQLCSPYSSEEVSNPQQRLCAQAQGHAGSRHQKLCAQAHPVKLGMLA